MTAQPRVAYLVRRFPVLSQTFVTNEIADHLRAGWDVLVIAIGTPKSADFPADRLDTIFRGRIRYLGMPTGRARRIATLAALAARHPTLLPAMLRAGRAGGGGGRSFSFYDAILTAKLAPLLAKLDILHCHFGDVGRIGTLVVRSLGLPTQVVTTLHGHDVTHDRFQPLGRYYASLIKRGGLMLPVNNLWRERLLAAGAAPDKVVVHHMGVDMDAHAARPIGTPGPAGSLRLALVGRLVEKKGQRLAVAALAELRERRPDLAIRLDIVGDGPLSGAVDKDIAAHGLSDRIVRHGALSHAESLGVIEAADAFLLPSLTAANGDMEGIPVALMEAMAMGCPVISTVHSGIPELVTDEESGLLAPEKDIGGIARAIERLADDPSLRTRLAVAGREAVARSFDAAALGETLRNHYRALADGWRE